MKNYFPFLKTRFEKVFEHSISPKPKFGLPNVFPKPDDNLIILANAIKILSVTEK
jgi:hypothetical protein